MQAQCGLPLLLPNSWTSQKIMEEFGATDYMVWQAKALAKEKGILATPNPKLSGRTLTQRGVEQVKDWYRSDEVSCVMPGMKDFVSVKMEKRIQIQKRFILCNLREAYESFKTKHTEVRVGFSKFADLRPKECVLAEAGGTHAVCV